MVVVRKTGVALRFAVILVLSACAARSSDQPADVSTCDACPAVASALSQADALDDGALISGAGLAALAQGGAFTLNPTTDPPLLSQHDAQQIALDTGYPYAVSLAVEGRPLTLTAYYGLATIGRAASTAGMTTGDGVSPIAGACANWHGPCDYPVAVCRNGHCQPTGKTIARFVQRPAWVLDYGGFHVERQGCPTCPRQIFTNGVLVVDALDGFVVVGTSYTATPAAASPSEP